MPLKYHTFCTDDYLVHDLSYVNYYMIDKEKVYAFAASGTGLFLNDHSHKLAYYIENHLPPITLCKYLIEKRAQCGYELLDDIGLDRIIQLGYMDLVKYTVVVYFNDFGDIDEFLYMGELYKHSEIIDWFDQIGFRYRVVSVDQIEHSYVGRIKMIMKFSDIGSDELIEEFCPYLDLRAISYLINL